MKKLAIIRSPGTRGCPYGLPIKQACENAGESVNQMIPLVDVPPEQKEKYKKANNRVLMYHFTGERCPFADKVVEHQDAVHCDFGEGGARLSDIPIVPSPHYPRVFNGIGQYGLYSYPMAHWTDDQAARVLFNGVFSLYAATGEVLINRRNLPPDPILEKLASELLLIKEE